MADFDNDTSLLRFVALGVAASNKDLRSPMLKVTPIEKLGFSDGEIADKVDTLEYSGTDSKGEAQSGTSFVGQTLEAQWFPSGNRKTAPHVRRGERIELWQFASNEKYYWRCLNLDEHLRRLETVVWGINANPSENQDGMSLDDMYFVEWSSHAKTITLSTSKKNGEFCTFDAQFNLATGQFILQDDLNNYWMFDAKNTLFKFLNNLGTLFEMNKEDINMHAPKNILADALQNITMTAGKNILIKAGVQAILQGGGSVLTLTSGGTTLKTPKFAGGA